MGMIILDRLRFSYSEGLKPVLDGLSCSFDSSGITVLTGASGCGKSTLLYIAAGLYPENAGSLLEGRVLLEGRDPSELAPPERCRLAGMMFQNPELQFCMDTRRYMEYLKNAHEDIKREIPDSCIIAFCSTSDKGDNIDKFTVQGLEAGGAALTKRRCLPPRLNAVLCRICPGG